MKNINVTHLCHSLHHVNQSCGPGYLCAHAHTTLLVVFCEPVSCPPVLLILLFDQVFAAPCSFPLAWVILILERVHLWGCGLCFCLWQPEHFSSFSYLFSFLPFGGRGGSTYEQIHGSPLDGPPARHRTLSEHLCICYLAQRYHCSTLKVIWLLFICIINLLDGSIYTWCSYPFISDYYK